MDKIKDFILFLIGLVIGIFIIELTGILIVMLLCII